MDEAHSLVDVHFLPVQGCRKQYFLPETAYPRRSGDRHDSHHAVGQIFSEEMEPNISVRDGATCCFSTRSLEEKRA